MKKRRKYKCANPEESNCRGEMRVAHTRTMKESVLRERRCTVCGYVLMTRELPIHPKRLIVSFSEMQKEAMRKNSR